MQTVWYNCVEYCKQSSLHGQDLVNTLCFEVCCVHNGVLVVGRGKNDHYNVYGITVILPMQLSQDGNIILSTAHVLHAG